MDETTGDREGWTASESMAEPVAELADPQSFVVPSTAATPTSGGDPATGEYAMPAAEVVVPRRRSRRPLVIVAAAVAAVSLVTGVLVATVGSAPNADAAVVTAINSAIGQKTAHVDVSGSVAVAGQVEKLTGTGLFDFTDNAEQMSLTIPVAGQAVDVQADYVGGSVYEELPQISQLVPGKDWVSIDLSSLQQTADGDATSQLGGDPMATLQALAQQGNSVSDLGSSVVDGQSVQGYAVTLDPAVVKRELNQADLPAWLRSLASKVTLGRAAQNVYLDAGGNLVRLSSDITERAGSAGPIKVQESLDFSDYGAPVSISTPPADQVIPFSQFLQLAGQSSAT